MSENIDEEIDLELAFDSEESRQEELEYLDSLIEDGKAIEALEVDALRAYGDHLLKALDAYVAGSCYVFERYEGFKGLIQTGGIADIKKAIYAILQILRRLREKVYIYKFPTRTPTPFDD